MKQLQAITEATTTTKTFWMLFWLVVLSVLLRMVPGTDFLLQPFTQFQVLLHEMSHALACVLTGGWVTGLTIVEDGNGHGGLTYTHGGIPLIYMQAGYMGEALWGCLLIALSRFPRISRIILFMIGLAVGAVTLWFMPGGFFTAGSMSNVLQQLFSLLWGLAMAAGLMFIGSKLSNKWAHWTLSFLAVQSCLSSLMGIFVLLLQSFGAFGNVWSDATNMARLTGIPSMFWGVWWTMFSVGMMSWTMLLTYKADKNVKTPASAAQKQNLSTPIVELPKSVDTKRIDSNKQVELELLELRRQAEAGQTIDIKPKQKAEKKKL